MDIDDFERSNESSHFIVVDSQADTQDLDEKQILCSLPALRQESPCSPIIKQTGMDNLNTKIFLPATDSESEVQPTPGIEQVIMETESETQAGSSSSENNGDVTVIEKTEREIDKEVISSSSHGSKAFELFKTSMSDNNNYEEEHLVSTPSHYIGSLHFSGQPILVPETVDESQNELSGSPEAYGDFLAIIPNSPTQFADEDSDEVKQTQELMIEAVDEQMSMNLDVETQNQDSLHLALTETDTGIMEMETQSTLSQNTTVYESKGNDKTVETQDLALHISPSEGEILSTGNSEKNRTEVTKAKSPSKSKMSGKMEQKKSKSMSQPEISEKIEQKKSKSTSQPEMSEEIEKKKSKSMSQPEMSEKMEQKKSKSTSQPEMSEEIEKKKSKSMSQPEMSEKLGDFHLSLPKEGMLLHPVIPQYSEKSQTCQREDVSKSGVTVSVTPGINNSTESTGEEASFHFQKPELSLMETNDESEENVFKKTKMSSGKPLQQLDTHKSEELQLHQSGQHEEEETLRKTAYDESTEVYEVERGTEEIEERHNTLAVDKAMNKDEEIEKTQTEKSLKPVSEPLDIDHGEVEHQTSTEIADKTPDHRDRLEQDNGRHRSVLTSRVKSGPTQTVTGKDKTDPYTFHSSQSQPREPAPTTSARKPTKTLAQSYPQTPLSTKKRKLHYRKTRIKRAWSTRRSLSSTEMEDNSKAEPPTKKLKQSVKKFTQLSHKSGASNPAASKTIELPATTSNNKVTLMSPTSTTGESQTTSKRRSVEFAAGVHVESQYVNLPVSMTPDSDDLIEKTIVEVTSQIIKHYKKVITSAKDGHVIETKEWEEHDEPVFLKKVEVTNYLNPILSPSRTGSSLTSGDLGDISSSGLSRHTSSGSKGGASLEIASLSKSQPDTTPRQEGNNSEEHSYEGSGTPDVSGIEKTDSRHGAVVSSAESKKTESLFTSPEIQKVSPPVTSPSRDKVASSSSLESDIPPAQTSCLQTRKSKSSSSSLDYLLREEKTNQNKSSQESGGFSVRGSGVNVCRVSQVSRLSDVRKSDKLQTEERAQKTNSTDDSDRLSPEIPVQSENPVQSVVRTPSKTHYASKLEIGAAVMARWKDGFYYPGRIVKMKDPIKYHITFDDGDCMVVKVQDILLIEQLPVGLSVMVMSQDGFFECGLIVEHQHNEDTMTYKVECDNGSTKMCSRSEIILSEDQASCLMSDEEVRIAVSTPVSSKSKSAVSLDNLVDGPRRSASKVRDTDNTSPRKKKNPVRMKSLENTEAKTSQSTDRQTKRRVRSLKAASTPTPNKGKRAVTKEKDETPKKASEKTPTKVKRPLSCQSESAGDGFVHSPMFVHRERKKKTGVTAESSATTTSEPPQSKIFAGMVFLLSHVYKSVEQKEQEKKILEDSSLETSTDENVLEEESFFSYDKSYLKTEIEKASGTILEKYDKSKIEAALACYLISDTFQRTVKYIQCLAAGIPCVSHLWIRDSCNQGKCLDIKAYLLPAGISIERRKLMEWSPNANCLEQFKVMIASSSTEFIDTWMQTLTICKCKIFNRLPAANASDDMMLDVIITDKSCPTNIKRRAAKLGIPVVSTEWVIQCLINGHQVGFDSHPRYRYDFSEK